MKLFCAPGTLSLLPHIVFLEAGLAFTAIKIDEHTKAIESGGDYRGQWRARFRFARPTCAEL